MCLDVLRGLKRHPELAAVMLESLQRDCADEPMLKQRVASLLSLLTLAGPGQQGAARHIAQELVLLVTASLLRRYDPPVMADAFIPSRFHLARRVLGETPKPLGLHRWEEGRGDKE